DSGIRGEAKAEVETNEPQGRPEEIHPPNEGKVDVSIRH
ncbi:MAG: hypothetical protein ACI9OJ_000646, partial [Myxococcota bacterium]